jgi:hypothetical protein
MPINIIKTHHVPHGQSAFNGTYDHLFWEIELVDSAIEDADFQNRLLCDDIWQVGIAGQGIKRLTYQPGSDSVLDHLVQVPVLQQEQFIRLAKGQHDAHVRTRWYRDAEYYVTDPDIKTVSTIYCDQAGFEMGVHLDNSHVMLQAVINLSDNETGTELYSVESDKPTYAMTGQRNHGIMFFNGPGTLHGIRNVNKDRHILYYGIMYGGGNK